jgi:hypothetical protein
LAWDTLARMSNVDGALAARTVATDGFRLLSRAGGTVHELMVVPHARYPFKLFAIATNPTRAAAQAALVCEDAADRRCIMDALSVDFATRFTSPEALLSEAALQELTCILEVAETDVARIEVGHSRIRRDVRAQVQTHARALDHSSAARVVEAARARSTSSWYVTAGLLPDLSCTNIGSGPGGHASSPAASRVLEHAKVEGLINKRVAQAKAKATQAGRAGYHRHGSGGGGAWRAFIRERCSSAGRCAVAADAEVYRALSPEERAGYMELGMLATALHKVCMYACMPAIPGRVHRGHYSHLLATAAAYRFQ